MNSNKKRERSREKEVANENKTKTTKNKKNQKSKKNNDKNIDKDNNQTININHHWKKYFDSRYNQIFYNNPFTGESVWELPEGAIVEESSGPLEIITQIKE